MPTDVPTALAAFAAASEALAFAHERFADTLRRRCDNIAVESLTISSGQPIDAESSRASCRSLAELDDAVAALLLAQPAYVAAHRDLSAALGAEPDGS